MLNELVRWTVVLSLVVAFVLAIRAWVTRPIGPRVACPGYSPRRLAWLDPRRLLWRHICGYDLSGQIPAEDGQVRCPECGRRRPLRRAIRRGRRLRTGVLAAGFALMGAGGLVWPWYDADRWAAGVPTLLLVALEGPERDAFHKGARLELAERVEDGAITGLQACLLSYRQAVNLRDDAHRANAYRAIDTLNALWPSSRPALEAALVSGDDQARVLAAEVLRWRCPAEPSLALLEACIVDIGSAPDGLRWYIRMGTCSDAARFLLEHAEGAAPLIENAMGSDDPHRRLVAAAIVGFAGLDNLVDAAAPILIGHLRDNTVRGDAKLAAPALYRLGEASRPYLEGCIEDPDPQLRASAMAILDRLEDPDSPAWRLEHQMPPVTGTTSDPLRHLSLTGALSDLRF